MLITGSTVPFESVSPFGEGRALRMLVGVCPPFLYFSSFFSVEGGPVPGLTPGSGRFNSPVLFASHDYFNLY